jgi:hypothetical protein
MNIIPNDTLIPKGLLTQIVLKLFDSYPIVKSFIPDMDTFMTNLQEGENIFNRMTAIYSSNMPQDKKVEEIQNLLPENTLSVDDVLDLTKKLDEAMGMYKQNTKGSFWDKIENPERLRKYGISELGSANDYRKLMNIPVRQLPNTTSASRGKQLYNAYDTQFNPAPKINADIDINVFNGFKLTSDTGEEISLNCSRARELIRMYATKCIHRLQYGGAKKGTSSSTIKAKAPAPAPSPSSSKKVVAPAPAPSSSTKKAAAPVPAPSSSAKTGTNISGLANMLNSAQKMIGSAVGAATNAASPSSSVPAPAPAANAASPAAPATASQALNSGIKTAGQAADNMLQGLNKMTQQMTQSVKQQEKSPLLNESNESLAKQYGYMQPDSLIKSKQEVDERLYKPAEIGGASHDTKNDRVMYRFQYDILNNKMNILSRLLITLSSVPVFGWFFDILLVAYAFYTKNFKLALYTIIGSLSVIGREFSKSLYLLDESQQMKKTLTNPSYARYNVDMDDGKYVKKTVPEVINGQYVLVDESGNIYSPVISQQRKIGKLSDDRRRVHFFNQPPSRPRDDEIDNLEIKDSEARKDFVGELTDILTRSGVQMDFTDSN